MLSLEILYYPAYETRPLWGVVLFFAVYLVVYVKRNIHSEHRGFHLREMRGDRRGEWVYQSLPEVFVEQACGYPPGRPFCHLSGAHGADTGLGGRWTAEDTTSMQCVSV